MEQLLADARKMRSASKAVEEKEKTAKDTVFEIISTIVTIDFFVVVALLVWFLAGIFCSSVLKDDTVQIAFNMNFERVTQPALGILMIGSVAGSLGKKENEED
jgi:Mn2+/Fe2+ NRAMP family transporter